MYLESYFFGKGSLRKGSQLNCIIIIFFYIITFIIFVFLLYFFKGIKVYPLFLEAGGGFDETFEYKFFT